MSLHKKIINMRASLLLFSYKLIFFKDLAGKKTLLGRLSKTI